MINKRKRPAIEQFLGSILDAQDAEVIVVRPQGHEFLYANASARKRMNIKPDAELTDCKISYSRLFPDLCKRCDKQAAAELSNEYKFDIEDGEGKVFSVMSKNVEWLDGKQATVMFLRDIDELRSAEKRLYQLAYSDNLTGIPNRQRFKEDFEAIVDKLEAGELAGMISIFDMDNFKSVNDTYGHNTGDIMLQRLTDHLQSDINFHDHIYRLGGDEFVLMFTHTPGTFSSEENCRAHYEELLHTALLSYTLPNIDLACTLSMGIAYFPEHGLTSSELLRKADIAMYQAKQAGGNQLISFEEQYDTAKKLKDMYINIQPILKAQGKTFGYELLDGGVDEEGEDEKKDEGENVAILSEFNRTLEALDLDDIENEAKYFINFTNQLHNPTVRNNIPKSKFIIQMHMGEDIKTENFFTLRKLKSYGYAISISGLTAHNMNPELMKLGDYFKFEPGSMDQFQQSRIAKQHPNKTFIATGVDTQLQYENARQLGFKLYQGFFFNQPVVTKKTKELDPLEANYLRLLKLTATDDFVDFKEISDIIASDVALSYKLLRLLNSAAVGLRNRVSSISMAVAYLGEEKLKKWISLLALRGLASDKPLELMRMSLIRAQFGELLAPHFKPKRDEKQVFMTGMFSLLHIALEKSKEEMLDEIPVADDIRESLLTKNGVYSDLLKFFNDYEYANWDDVNKYGRDHDIPSAVINDCYIAAVKWYNDLVGES